MTPGFLRGDELIQSSSGELLYVVRGVIPRIQRVKVLDMASRNEVLVDDADLRPKVASGELRVLRQGKDWTQALHDRSGTDDQAHQDALQFLNEVLQLRQQYEVSFNRAYDMFVNQVLPERGDQAPKVLSLSQAYRLWERERNGVPLHVGNAAKGNRHLRYPEEGPFPIIAAWTQSHSRLRSNRPRPELIVVSNRRMCRFSLDQSTHSDDMSIASTNKLELSNGRLAGPILARRR